jgi:ring-1,2-phenylacetyl-CoA epoxidase subunit PaaC
VADKAVKEVAYHRDHAVQWTVRLGDGTAESARRMRAGLDRMWPLAEEMFESDPLVRALAAEGVSVDPPSLRPEWERTVDVVLAEATLRRPVCPPQVTGGRRGVHSEGFGHLLAEMQHLHRSHPGARW